MGKIGKFGRNFCLFFILLLSPGQQSAAVIINYAPHSPVGPQTQVNTHIQDLQINPSVASGADTVFVVVWESYSSPGTDASVSSIQAQRYFSNNQSIGVQFQVNSYTDSHQGTPDVAMRPDSAFVVTWHSDGSTGTDNDGGSIQMRRYYADGTPVGNDFQVNSHTTGNQSYPAVAYGPGGEFVVVWQSESSPGDDNSHSSIQARRFSADGTPEGDQFQVNTYTDSTQIHPDIAFRPDGDFVVTWESDGSAGTDDSSISIQMRRFDADGSPIGNDTQVNSYTTNNQQNPAVATGQDNEFVIVWQSQGSAGSDSDGSSIQMQRFDADGNPAGDQFQVNTAVNNDQQNPVVLTTANEESIVAWDSFWSEGSDSSGASIQMRHFNADGSASETQWQVNTWTENEQIIPALVVLPGDDFTVVWQSYGSPGTDDDQSSIQMQRFSLDILTDGFE
jgi:hypothetical protein